MADDLDDLLESAITQAIADGDGKVIGRLVREAMENAGLFVVRPRDPSRETGEPPQYMRRLSAEQARKRQPMFDASNATKGAPPVGVIRCGLAKRPVRDMTLDEMRVEHARLVKLWDDLRSDPEAGRGGSPGEWMIERMGEIESRLMSEFGRRL